MSKRTPQDVLEAWGNASIPVDDAERAAARREATVRNLAGFIRQSSERRQRSRRSLRMVGALALAATVALGAFGAWRLTNEEPAPSASAAAPVPSVGHVSGSGEVELRRQSDVLQLTSLEEQPLQQGDALRTGETARAQVVLASQVQISLRGSTTLALDSLRDDAASVSLRRGDIDVQVAKRLPGQTFEVATPHADVLVRGTRFQVVVSEPSNQASTTTVRVREGLVVVRHAGREIPLGPGEQWTSLEPPLEVPEPATSADPQMPTDSEIPTPAPSGEGPARPSKTSQLSEQNRAFQSAMVAKRAGNDAAVVRILSQLLAKYPKSPLAAEASAERADARRRMASH